MAATAEARPVTAEWDANTDPYTVGYRLYVGTAPGVYLVDLDVGNVTSYRLDVPELNLFFVVRAYNAEGALSPPSNEAFLNGGAGGGGNLPPTVFNPGDLVVPAGPVATHYPASDPEGAPLTFTAAGLPPGLSINPSTGFVSGVLASPGTYNVTVSVSDGQLSAQASFRLTVLGGACSGPPAAATVQPAVVSGNQVTISWTTPAGGIGPSSYLLEVGSGSGQNNIAAVEVPATMTTFSATAPNGRYFLRVGARNACGVSPSNEIDFTIGGGPSPGGPVPSAPKLSFQRSGTAVTLAWTPPASGSADSYLIEVGSASGLANLLSYNTASAARTLRANAPPGRYFVRIRAVNANGAGAASNEVVVTVP